MKKLLSVLLMFLLIIAVCLLWNFKSNILTVSEKISNVLTEYFSAENLLRKTPEYGVIGRDTVCLVGDGKFQIGKYGNNKAFVMHNKNGTTESLLNNVLKYKKKRGVLYVISSEGYGVVDGKTGKCRLLVTIPSEKYVSGYSVDEDGNRHYHTRFLEDENITYLSSYDEFTNEEKRVFKKMGQKGTS